jgi:hypothetical protein
MVDAVAFCECHDAGDHRIRQGDVFEWLGNDSADPWTKFGVVVTADCDIVHAKHRGVLSYVPLLELRDYLALFHLPAKLQRGAAPIREQLVKVIRMLQAECAPEFSVPLSEEAALRWVAALTVEGVAKELGVPPERNLDDFRALAADFALVQTAIAAGTFDQLFAGLVQVRKRRAKGNDDVHASIWKDIEDHISRLPGDAFFISSLTSHQYAGYVAYLRLVREIDQEHIAIRQTDLRASSVRAKRIAALNSPYIYRLTQSLAAVFADIGLPSEYEDARQHLLRRVADDLTQTPRPIA